MPSYSKTLLVTFAFAALEPAVSLHGATSMQIPSAGTPVPEATKHSATPVHVPPPPTASPKQWSLPWGQKESEAPADRGPLLVQPRAATSRGDHMGIALPELKIQRFGHSEWQPDDVKELPPEEPAVHPVTMAPEKKSQSIDSFFQTQMDSEPASKAHAARQVGEVVADNPAAGQTNISTPAVPDHGIGFVAAAKPPPALSAVPPLPFVPDEGPAPTHVEAVVATQEVSGGSTHVDAKVSTAQASASAAPAASVTPAFAGGKSRVVNATLEDQAEAWSNFTAAEALRSQHRDTEALGTDAASEALPVATHAPGTQAPKETAATQSPKDAATVALPAKATQSILTPSASRPSTDGGSNKFVYWLFGMSCMVIVGGFCLGCLGVGFVSAFVWQRHCGAPTVRHHVEELSISTGKEVERRLPCSGGYDCRFSKPLSSGQLMRLEAYVDGPAVGNTHLTTPLSGQACVLYSVAVSRQLHDGIRPAPVAFASGCVDFVISLKDAPHVRINLRAEELSLFDMRRGKRVERKAFASAPEKWQEFILTHRSGTEWQTSSQMRADSSSLEFQECTLLCGALATFVGELHRGADGALSLRPLQLDSLAPARDVSGAPPNSARARSTPQRWQTSWECGGPEVVNVAEPLPVSREKDDEMHFDKVMVSDDPLLIDGATSLLRRLPAKCSSRAMSCISKYRYGKWTGSQKSPAGFQAHTL